MIYCPFIIMHIPERKKPCLFIKDKDTSIVKIASFNDEESAQIFAKTYNDMIDAIFEKRWQK